MKIHIFGSMGFIGKKLVEKFLTGGYDVKGYSHRDCDLLVQEPLTIETKPEDIIIFASSITRLKENSFDSMIKNIKMTDKICKFLEKNPVMQIIFLSSTDVYGINPKIPINEKNELFPSDYYANSKLASEFLLKNICSKKGVSLFILRMTGVYGPGDEGRSTINKLIRSARDGKMIITGDGETKRDFIYVDDIYEIIKLGINKKINLTVNITTGKSYSINEIAEMIKKHSKEEFFLEHIKEEKKDRAKELIYDISLVKKIFPEIKFMDLETGIKNCLGDINSFKESLLVNQMGRIDLMRNYPKVKRDLDKREEEKTEEDKIVAKRYGKEFFDGDRKQGYGGYNYHPRFWSQVVRDIIKHYQLTKDSRILDVGCAKGFMLYDFMLALPGVKVRGIDISDYAIKNAKPEVKKFLSVGNAKDLREFGKKEFDLVVSINTVHNLPIKECKQAISEIQRVGKNAFITVDAWENEEGKEKMFKWNLTAETLLNVDDWKKLFKEAGYTGDYYWFMP